MPKKIIYSTTAYDMTSEVISILLKRKLELGFSYQDIQNVSNNESLFHSTAYRYLTGKNQMDLLAFFELCKILAISPIDVMATARKNLDEKRKTPY